MKPQTLYLFVLICFVTISAQTTGNQNFQSNGDRPERDRRRQLSPQQQGHILSDIQQHQHRFQLHQNYLKSQAQQKPTQVLGIQPSLATEIQPEASFQQPFTNNQQPQQQAIQQPLTSADQTQHPESLLQPQLPLVHQNHQFNSHTNGQPSLLNPQAQFLGHSQQASSNLNVQPILPSISTPLQSQLTSQGILNNPTQSPLINRAHIQHHTQTAFKSNYLSQPLQPTKNPVNVITNLPPVTNPLFTDDQNSQLSAYFDPEKHQQRLKDLRLKQQIIEKHNQFVERQYEKALKKAQEEHQDWLEKQSDQRKKLYQSLYRPGAPRILNFAAARQRYIFPEEIPLFKKSVDEYYQEHPTTTTTTTTTTAATTTTEESKLIELPDEKIDAELFLPNSRQKLYSELKTTVEREAEASEKQFLPTALPEPKAKPIKSIEQLDLLQKQYQQQLLQREDLLRQLKLAIAETPEEEPNKTFSAREISLPGGQTVQIVKTLDPKLIPGVTPLTSESIASPKILQVISTPATTTTTTAKPPKALLEELTKGVLPPGADFEVIKHNPNGGLEELGNLPPNLPNQKKVTFVLLEEQHDGSYKVQGVRGNTENQKGKDSVDVDSILTRIQNGEIKLPPPTRTATSTESINKASVTNDIKAQSTAYATPSQNPRPTLAYQTTNRTIKPQVTQLSSTNPDSEISPNAPVITTNIGTQFIPSSTQATLLPNALFTYSSKYSSTTPAAITSSKFIPIQNDHTKLSTSYHSSAYYPTSTEQIKVASTSSTVQKPVYSTAYGGTIIRPSAPVPTPQASVNILQSQPLQTIPTEVKPTEFSEDFAFTSPQSNMPLVDILKKKGLFAMAKFLRQSGLDTILNETGPYTIFVPNDKAFKTLLIQLGGPEKAEEKFKENPRLLSGLLLHHVIPGAFEIRNLQDEMTGVSLAGTQLRVNQYAMQDVEWNEVKATTINGAKVIDDRQDIDIPQGVAHAIDRVMFPLPVGDLVQTLQSDRERRFTTFLRVLFASGLADTFQGTKTFTVFAPVDRGFTSLSSEQLNQLVSDRAIARDFVMRHIIPGTLYTSGMRYYQVKDSLQPDKQISLSKTSGRIKVNNIPMITQNVPATNGVIHAIDSLL